MFKNLKLKIKNSSKGITLVEIVVVIFIITLFSVILISDFPKIQRQFALSRVTYKLAQDLRKTEDFGFSGITIKDSQGDPVTAMGYGIYIDFINEPTKYIIYADVKPDSATPGDSVYNGNFSTPLCSSPSLPPVSSDCVIEEIIDISEENPSLHIKDIKNNIDGNSIIGSSMSINFMPPNPTVNIKDNEDNTYPAGIEIVLGLTTDPSAERKILVNSSGLINIVR